MFSQQYESKRHFSAELAIIELLNNQQIVWIDLPKSFDELLYTILVARLIDLL